MNGQNRVELGNFGKITQDINIIKSFCEKTLSIRNNDNNIEIIIIKVNMGSNIIHILKSMKMNSKIKSIVFYKCIFGSKGMTILCNELKNTKINVCIEQCDISTLNYRQLANMLSNYSLNKLSIFSPITNDFYSKLKHFNLQILVIRIQTINELKLLCDGLKKNKTIRYLQYSGGVSGYGSETKIISDMLKINKSIISLNLNSNYIYDGLPNIADALLINNTLKELFLRYTLIEDIQCLGNVLKYNTTLETLDLSMNSIKKLDYFVESIKDNKTLKELRLDMNLYNDTSYADNIIKIINTSSITCFQSKWSGFNTNICHAIANNKNLVELHFSNFYNIHVDQFIDIIKDNTTIQKITFEYVTQNMEKLDYYLKRNNNILKKVNNAINYIIDVRYNNSFDKMGDFSVLPKDIVKMIAKELYKTKGDKEWL